MPPKKEKKAVAEDGEMTAQIMLETLKYQNSTIELQLREVSQIAINAQLSKAAIEKEEIAIRARLSEHQKSMSSRSQGMTKQFDALQDMLQEKRDLLQITVDKLKTELHDTQMAKRDVLEEKERELNQKEQDITLIQAKMDEMSEEFSGMLKQTLQKMQERITLSNTTRFE